MEKPRTYRPQVLRGTKESQGNLLCADRTMSVMGSQSSANKQRCLVSETENSTTASI